MARVLVVDHHDSYVWNLVHLIAGVTGELPDVVEHDADVSFDGYTHVVLSPGPGHPATPSDFALQARAFDHGLPVLGVCLGMQALVTTYGGTVEAIEPAHGVVAAIEHAADPLFASIPQGFEAVRYHSLAAVELSDDVEPIAWTTTTTTTPRRGVTSRGRGVTSRDRDVTSRDRDVTSRVVMAVRHRTLPQVGVQFHPESILTEFGSRLVANFLEST